MESPKHRSLRFVSWNTMGIRYTGERSSKLKPVLDELNKLKADVVFLQETHIGPESYEVLENIEGWRSFFTVHLPRSKGVAILIKNETIFNYICHDEDYSGGYIVLFCHLNAQLFTLVNVYNHEAERDMLHRLRNYLTAIHTKGVLVVGGDFNTVLDPVFDRRSAADQTYQSSLRSILEDFTESLSLKDVFASMYPSEEGFTRSQNQSHSRLDMFFMSENTIEGVMKCEIQNGKIRKSTTGETRISDHDPLVLHIQIKSLLKNEMPEVASMLKDFGYCGAPDRRAGKINGAEILSAIRSLPDSQHQTPDKLSVYDYKKNDLAMTEILKINYNKMLKSNYVPTLFVKSVPVLDNMHCFNVDYLIFAHIFAKRLKVFLTSSVRKRTRAVHSECICLIFAKCPPKIKESFLKESLWSPKSITPAPSEDFTILNELLPEASPNNGFRKLRKGCPLTTPILTMALKKLEKNIKGICPSITSVCHFRQCLLVCTDNQRISRITEMLSEFEEYSGLKMYIKHIQRSK